MHAYLERYRPHEPVLIWMTKIHKMRYNEYGELIMKNNSAIYQPMNYY